MTYEVDFTHGPVRLDLERGDKVTFIDRGPSPLVRPRALVDFDMRPVLPSTFLLPEPAEPEPLAVRMKRGGDAILQGMQDVYGIDRQTAKSILRKRRRRERKRVG